MADSVNTHVLVELADGVATITFNRPEKKNAFTIAMYEAVLGALEQAAADPSVRCVLLTGSGNAFTAGNDLFDFMNNPPTGLDSAVLRFLMALIDFEKPLVAAVNGVAVGVGVTMLMHCDLSYAANTAMFTAPFVPLGLVPEAGSSWVLPRMAGHAKAGEILLLGEPFDATTACDVGLVSRVLPAAELMAHARARCQRLVQLPAGALRDSKRLMRAGTQEQLKRAFMDEARIFGERLSSPEATEAFTAFFEKRKPDFSRFS